MKNNTLSFKGQEFFIGIDVHKNSWNVSIRSQNLLLESFKMNPIPEQLALHLKMKYPDGLYHSVYEAGFCGFWIHHKLDSLGINNIVVNPADVPTTNKEKDSKTDPRDSKKLARELENGTLKSIHIQSIEDQTLKCLCRLRITLGSDMTRIKNRISAYLNLFGCKIDEESRWTGGFIKSLYSLANKLPNGETLISLTDSLKSKKEEILKINKDLKEAVIKAGKADLLRLLMTVPGIGFLSGTAFITEIIDIKRFKDFSSLSSFVGLVPSISASGEKETVNGLTNRRHRLLIKMLVEASWVAVRKDPALLRTFSELSKRMKKQKAIIRIAKKILNRIKAVWISQRSYKICYN